MPRDSITLGMPISLSGRYAMLGRQVLAGLQCYVRAVNAAGGIYLSGSKRSLPVALIAHDDEGREKKARDLVERLINEDAIDVLLGPYGSGLTFAATEAADAAGMVLFNHSGSADSIFARQSQWMVGIISPASRYLCSVLDALRARDPAARTIAIVSTETGFAGEVAQGAVDWINEQGLELSLHQRYPSGLEDFRDLVGVLKEEPPDWLLGVGRIEDDVRLAHELCEIRPEVKATALVVAAIDHFRQALGDASDGFLAPSQWEPQVRYAVDCGPLASEFLERYRQASALSLDYPAAQAYAAGVIVQRCIETAGSLEQKALRDAARGLRCTSFYGPFAIDGESGRQTAHPMLTTQWQAGGKKIVWPPLVAEATIVYPGPFRQ